GGAGTPAPSRRRRAAARRADPRHRRGEQGPDLWPDRFAGHRCRRGPAGPRGAARQQLLSRAAGALRPHRGDVPAPAGRGAPGRRAGRASFDPRSGGDGGRGVRTRELLARGGPLLGLILVSALFGALVGPQFFSPANLELIARQTAIVGTAALGMTLVIAAAGIDLSVGSVISLSTAVIALMLRSARSPGLAAAIGIAAAALCGAVTGLLVTGLRVVPFLVTLGMMLRRRGRDDVREALGGRPDGRGGARAGRDRGGDHRRGQPARREGHGVRHAGGRGADDGDPDRVLAARLAELGAADRERGSDHGRGRARPLAPGCT